MEGSGRKGRAGQPLGTEQSEMRLGFRKGDEGEEDGDRKQDLPG